MILLNEKKCISYEIQLLKTELAKRKADLVIVQQRIKNSTRKKLVDAQA